MEDTVATVMKAAQELLGHPLALPVAVGIATVLFTVVLFFSLGQKGGKRPRKKSARASAAVGGTTTVDGVRRSTRAHKSSTKLLEEFAASPAPGKASPTKKAPETPAEATTVTPKRRGRPPKTPVAEVDATTPKRRGRPPKSASK